MSSGICGHLAESLKCGRRGRPKVVSDECLRDTVAGEARKLFMECGYVGMTMDDLAGRCQMSKRTLYRLFPGKREIFSLIAEEHRQAMLGLPFDDDEVDLTEALRRIFRLDIDEDEHLDRMAMMRMFKQECPGSDEMTGILKEKAYDLSMRYFVEWIARQVALGRMRKVRPEFAAKIMFDMFFGGLFTPDRKIREWSSNDERREYMEQCLAIFVDGTRA